MRKLGIGALGVGAMGKRHAENIRRFVPEARLVAVADPAPGRASQLATELEIEHGFLSLDDMLESERHSVCCDRYNGTSSSPVDPRGGCGGKADFL